MKKYFFLLVFLFLPCISKADIMKSSKEEPVAVHYSLSNLTASTSTIVICLSSTTVFPHKSIGAINISALRLTISKVATSSGTIKLGVVYGVNDSTGDVKFFYSYDYSNSAALTEIIDKVDFNTFLLRTKVDLNGNTPYLISNDLSTANTNFQNDLNIPRPNGIATPGKGDIVLVFTNSGAGSTNITIDLLYNSEP